MSLQAVRAPAITTIWTRWISSQHRLGHCRFLSAAQNPAAVIHASIGGCCKPNTTMPLISYQHGYSTNPVVKDSSVSCSNICSCHDISQKPNPMTSLSRNSRDRSHQTDSRRSTWVRHHSTIPDPEFRAFYHFPYIVPMRLFSRLKLTQTIVTVGLVPTLHIAESYGIVSGVDKSMMLSLAALALSMLYAMGEFFRRLVGIMYLSRDRTQVKLAHLTFWGNRTDLVVPVSDIVPLRDCAEDKDVVNKVRRFSTNQFLLISIKYGRVLDPELFQVVFGELRSAGGGGR